MKNIIPDLRVGTGFDAHAFCTDRPLILGGVTVPYDKGLAGHSDADVLIHTVIDALLGAADCGDIGKLFPDTDAAYKGISSILLLERIFPKIMEKGWSIVNIDSIIICERPKIGQYTDAMKANISAACGGLDVSRIGIKGKTTEKLGFTGRGEGIACQAVALLAR
ncbi:MAG TPA: 2-C-methyl-D-erythritol 2,4-cyclodiphosphate synthase [Spirochaetota bacterium]|nr:2-C-methyl-D-erythritol 2,4-cyclodiphosphate synthase [Spirochaetota bacterium]